MNSINTGAHRRHTISPRNSRAGNDRMAQHVAFAALLPAAELRRLVAAMVD